MKRFGSHTEKKDARTLNVHNQRHRISLFYAVWSSDLLFNFVPFARECFKHIIISQFPNWKRIFVEPPKTGYSFMGNVLKNIILLLVCFGSFHPVNWFELFSSYPKTKTCLRATSDPHKVFPVIILLFVKLSHSFDIGCFVVFFLFNKKVYNSIWFLYNICIINFNSIRFWIESIKAQADTHTLTHRTGAHKTQTEEE